jgi:hypothetical protein
LLQKISKYFQISEEYSYKCAEGPNPELSGYAEPE